MSLNNLEKQYFEIFAISRTLYQAKMYAHLFKEAVGYKGKSLE